MFCEKVLRVTAGLFSASRVVVNSKDAGFSGGLENPIFKGFSISAKKEVGFILRLVARGVFEKAVSPLFSKHPGPRAVF